MRKGGEQPPVMDAMLQAREEEIQRRSQRRTRKTTKLVAEAAALGTDSAVQKQLH